MTLAFANVERQIRPVPKNCGNLHPHTMNKKSSKPKPEDRPRTTAVVKVEFHHPTAREVFIAGNFNDWHPAASPMVAMPGGRWVKELALPPGRYEYRFVVDGVWQDDPAAAELVDNGLGSRNAVLHAVL